MGDCIDKEVGYLITQYELDVLNEEERTLFEDHLLECSFCRRKIEELHPYMETIQQNKKQILKELAHEGVNFSELKQEILLRSEKIPHKTGSFNNIFKNIDDFFRGIFSSKEIIPALAMTAILIFFLIVPPHPVATNPYLPLVSFDQAFYQQASFRSIEESSVAGDFKQGMEYYLEEDYPRAIAHLKTAADADSAKGDYWLYLGVSYFLNRHAEEAIEALSYAVTICESVQKNRALWYLAQSYLSAGNAQMALPALETLASQGFEYSAEADTLLSKIGALQEK